MNVEVFEREWHGIAFDRIGVSTGAGEAAGPAFYAAFYDRFQTEGAEVAPRWLQAKSNLADWIESAVLRPRAGRGPGAVTVLSLGAGFGMMEEIWLRRGYSVAVQECQVSSLRTFCANHPDVPVYIGDARSVAAPSSSFDVVVLSALDYVYDRPGYAGLLYETARLLRRGGTAVMVTVSNLSAAGLVKALAKRMLVSIRGDIRAGRVVRWGWKRTLSEHVRLGAQSALRLEAVYAFDDLYRARPVPSRSIAAGIPQTTPRIAVVWSRA